MMGRLANRIALVTGAGSGIGRATALSLSTEGASVAVTDRNVNAADAVTNEIVSCGGDAIAVRLDSTSEADWQAAIDLVMAEWGRLDILVNNAGVGGTRDFVETSLEDWHAILRVNLDGVFLGTRFGVAAMRSTPSRRREFSGSIVNVSSMLGEVGFPEAAPYCASKGGVRLLTKAVAIESAEKGWDVRLNSVQPGFILTPMVQSSLERTAKQMGGSVEAPKKAIAALHPLGRLGTAAEVAAAIVYLASDDASFVTGSELTVDGGFTAR